jgi:signal transduction histidine kinase/DNA-binding response OmpR family regulator
VITVPMISALAWITYPTPLVVIVYALAALLTLTATAALALMWKLRAEQRNGDRDRQRLQQQKQYIQSLLDALPFPVMAKDRDGLYLMVNTASRRLCGIDIQAIGKTSLALPSHGLLVGEGNVPANRLFHDSSLAAVIAGQEQQREMVFVDSTGSRRAGLWWDCPIYTGDRGVIGSLGVLLDITRFRDNEMAARATELSLQEITQRIPVVVFTVHRGADNLRRLAFLAGDLRAFFDVDPQDLGETRNVLRDWPIFGRVHPEDQASVRELIFQATRHLRIGSLDFRAYGVGGLRWIHLTMAPRKLADGGVQWTGYLIDTTSINARNEVLRTARDAAERASKAKADFLATMSHEIRTPMNGVVGMIELLSHTQLDAEQEDLLHAVEDSAGVLLQVLNDVLDFSKLEAGNLRLDEAPFDPRTLADNIVSSMSAHMHRNGLNVQVAVDATLAGMLQGDSVRIRQVLLNLLNNASKFTERGSIVIGMRVLGDDGTTQHLRISVSDTGIGIAADKQTILFTPFAQAESWTTRRYGGTGLGLAICRHLVQLMSGSIRLDSELGVGTTVTVDLQLPVIQREAERPPGLAGRHAVVRMASTETAAALAGYLTALGITAERILPSEPIRAGLSANLIFIDPEDQETTSIAAQTIVVESGQMVRSVPFAQNDIIYLNANPLKWQSVTRACVMALERINPQTRSVAAQPLRMITPLPITTADNDHRGRILVAEDHPVGRALAHRQFELLGWPCDVVEDGQAAYQALLKGNYSMLLTDCQMPVMNGYQLAMAWRRLETERGDNVRMPVIAMTASALDGEIMRCRAAGMDDYLSKPVQLHELGKMIESWMPRSAAPKRPAAPLHDTDKTTADFAGADLIELNPDLLRVMQKTSEADLKLLDQAIASADTVEAEQRLHRMLGALQFFTNSPLLAEGRQLLETLADESADSALRRLPSYAEELRHLLRDLAGPN